jgi:hypothetical protein
VVTEDHSYPVHDKEWAEAESSTFLSSSILAISDAHARAGGLGAFLGTIGTIYARMSSKALE